MDLVTLYNNKIKEIANSRPPVNKKNMELKALLFKITSKKIRN